MNWLVYQANRVHDVLDGFRKLDFLAPLALRFFLAPVFIAAGLNKLNSFASTVEWFGNADWGLGLPAPALLVALTIAAELGGGLLLLVGLATRYVAVPLIITMLVAMCTVHWDNGWFAIAPSDPQTSMAQPLATLGIPGGQESLENSREVSERLEMAKSLLREHGNYDWLTEKGNFAIVNDGVEFAVTYLIMLLVLFFQGAGRFVSLDYWIHKRFRRWQG